MNKTEIKKQNTLFYQSKCDYFRQFTMASVLIACIGSILYFVSDCQLFGSFAWKTLLPRISIIIPAFLYIHIYKRLKDYRTFVLMSYIVLHLIMLNTSWAIIYLPDKSHASEGYIVIQIAFFAVGFCAPFAFSTASHMLFILEIFISHAINHFENFSLMLSLGIPVALCTIAAQFAMSKLYEIHYATAQDLEEATLTDVLTGVGNRRSFYLHAEEFQKEKKPFAIAYIDIDRLKKCNDQYGHSEGDLYITSVCDSLNAICENDEFVYRIGGDEFILLSPVNNAVQLEKKILQARLYLYEKFKNKKSYIADFSFGVVDAQIDREETISDLLSHADRIMYRYKVVHYMEQKHAAGDVVFSNTNAEIDKSGLDHRIFEVFANTSDQRYTYICNMNTDISRWSVQAVRDFGLPSEYMLNAKDIWAEHIHPDDLPAYFEDIDAVFSGQKPYHDIEYRARLKDGTYVRCTCEGCILRGKNDQEPDLFAGTITNHGIVDYIDSVTGCYNIYEFLHRLKQLRKREEGGVIMIVGMNQFGDINNSLGYINGNKALKEFADQSRNLLSKSEQIYRLDGAKFAFLLSNDRENQLNNLFNQLYDIANRRIIIDGKLISMHISGAAIQSEQVSMDETVILNEIFHIFAMAKKSRDGILHLYNEEKQQEVNRQMQLMENIKKSIRQQYEGFFLVYQPLVNNDGEMIGVESLLRWKNSDGQIIPPAQYISMLEKDESFYDLGLWILKTALKDNLKFVKKFPEFTVSVNVSYTQIDNYNFRKDVINIIEEVGYPAENLLLELTEHCQTMNPEILLRYMNFFHQNNIRIAADDFGTGYSSYSLMKILPFDYIKIDQSFIKDLEKDKADQEIVSSMIQCANLLGMKVCIEGVETREIFELIRECKPDYYQGYLFSKPLPLAEIENIL